MRFTKLSITKKAVHLSREDKNSQTGAIEEIDLTSPEGPLPSFADALQAFGSYVNDLCGVPEPWRKQMTVTTLSLSESKDGRRGLQVTVVIPVEKANGNPIVFTTPLVMEPGENATGESFALSDKVIELVNLAEAEGTRYAEGERSQISLFTKPEKKSSKNAKDVDERMAAASSASTRKPKGRTPKAKASQAPLGVM